jgi:Ni,Fe-hydrogenase I cytochrome b subunit
MIHINSLWNIPRLSKGNLATSHATDVVTDDNTLLFVVLDRRGCHVEIAYLLVCNLRLRIYICSIILCGGRPSFVNLHLSATWLLLAVSLNYHWLLNFGS